MNQTDSSWVPVHRVVFPDDDEYAVLPLYVDWRQSVVAPRDDVTVPIQPVPFKRVVTDIARRSIVVPANERLSTAAFFNAFPASYWRQWTRASTVRLRLRVDGPALIDVIASNARGGHRRVDGAEVTAGEYEFDLSLTSFGDGGWLWFDVQAASEAVKVSSASWLVREFDGYRPKKVAVAVTTFNRPDDCVQQMRRFAGATDLRERLSRLIITDQGTQLVAEAEGFDEAADELGGTFELIRQANLGGSGGFSRGMVEGLSAGADHVLLLDDDVVIEPEGILRAVQFADFAIKPTIVGGHMFSLYERSTLHNFGERIDMYTFDWGVTSRALSSLDLGSAPLRAVPGLHRRVDVDYTGWWMCLIPREVIEEIGLSLPVFIKWDDAEYALRARDAGFPTVTLPGSGVWHVPWTDKNDGVDWQAYFHMRNRWLAALLHSPYPRGGGFPRLSFAVDVRHLLSMQYSTVALHIKAMEDLLRGPVHLHESLPTINPEVRSARAAYIDARVMKDVATYPEIRRSRPLPPGRGQEAPKTIPAVYARALLATVRAARRVPKEARKNPQARVASADALWWRLAIEDSALVSTADGAGVSLYVRDRKEFNTLLLRSLRLHLRLLREWDSLRRAYRTGLHEYTSPAAWLPTFNHGRVS